MKLEFSSIKWYAKIAEERDELLDHLEYIKEQSKPPDSVLGASHEMVRAECPIMVEKSIASVINYESSAISIVVYSCISPPSYQRL
jgi:hypothetical protein